MDANHSLDSIGTWDQVVIIQTRLQQLGQPKQQQAPHSNLTINTKRPDSVSQGIGVYGGSSKWNNVHNLPSLI